jgi:hypothetical protein
VASNPVYLVRCLFLLYSLFLCVAYAVEVSFDKKGLLEAVQGLTKSGVRNVKTLTTFGQISSISEFRSLTHTVVQDE